MKKKSEIDGFGFLEKWADSGGCKNKIDPVDYVTISNKTMGKSPRQACRSSGPGLDGAREAKEAHTGDKKSRCREQMQETHREAATNLFVIQKTASAGPSNLCRRRALYGRFSSRTIMLRHGRVAQSGSVPRERKS